MNGIENEKCNQPVRGGKVVDPPDKRGMAQLDRLVEHAVQREKHGNLNHHGQAPAQGIDLVSLVQGHGLLVHLLFVVLVFFPDLGHQRLDLFHLAHGLIAL